jgi:DNA helicase-2/ATP-dependent DNA helicase PcrA
VSVVEPESYLADLNEAQREAVTTTEGPLLVIAGAGSGKTRVLTRRAAYLLAARGVEPNEILALTFTNKAAGEMRRRIEETVGRRARAIWILTFHAACGRILRREAERLGYRSNFTIYDQADQVRLVRTCLEELGRDLKRFPARAVHNQISRSKNLLIGPDEYGLRVASFFDQTVADVYALYQRRLFGLNAVDFDDLLMLTVEVLSRFPEAQERWANAFGYLMVDEYQDTNHAQYALLKQLAGVHRNLMAVGDPDQCLVAGSLVTMADGSTKPIEDVAVGDRVRSCYGRGSFGSARVSRVHSSRRRSGIAITTSSGRRIVSTPEHVHFAGFAAGEAPGLHVTYLLWRRGQGFRLGRSRSRTPGSGGWCAGPGRAGGRERADACWVIGTHADGAASRLSEAALSRRYGLPTAPFSPRPRHGDAARGRAARDPGALARDCRETGTLAGARRLLADEGLSLGYPHFRAGAAAAGERPELSISLCGGAGGGRPLHRIALRGSDEAGRAAAESHGLSPRPALHGASGWRYERAEADFGRIVALADRLEEELELRARFEARLAAEDGGAGSAAGSIPFMPASSVRVGMVMVTDGGLVDTVRQVERVVLERPVYDIDVEHTHNFIADGLLTHNSIYAFRGADIRNILQFERDFAGTRTIALEQNYRSANSILIAANALISHNRERKEKDLWSELGQGEPVAVVETEDEHAEARFVATEVERQLDGGTSLGEIAVIYRTNAQSRVLEDLLVRAGTAYQVLGGLRFYERAEIRDALAYLRVIDNPADAVSLVRSANRPRRGVGETSLRRLQALAESRGITLWEALGRAEEAGLATASLRAVVGWRSLLQSLMADALELPIAALLEKVIERTEYFPYLLSTLPKWEAEGKIENLEELVGVAREYAEVSPDPSLSNFLQEISLFSDQDALTEEAGGGELTLMTAHNAKGLEFRVVFMLGMEEGIFPHSRALQENTLEEERRLCYVGMTRAKERLTMLHASHRSLYGRTEANLPSRFLDELAGERVERSRLAPTSWSAYGAPPAPRAARSVHPIPALSTGDTVRHETLGVGIVTRIEPDAVVTVRFEDGTERRLLLEYAVLEKVLG